MEAEFLSSLSKKLKGIAKDIDEYVNKNYQELLFEIPPIPNEGDEMAILRELKSAFMVWYQAERGINYYWLAKDVVAMKRIIRKLKDNIENPDNESIKKSFEIVLSRVRHVDDFVYQNMNVGLLDSKFVGLMAKVKDSTETKSKDAKELENRLKDININNNK